MKKKTPKKNPIKSIQFNQLNRFTWRVQIINDQDLHFFTIINCPSPPPNEQIADYFFNDPLKWVIDLQLNKDYFFIKEEVNKIEGMVSICK